MNSYHGYLIQKNAMPPKVAPIKMMTDISSNGAQVMLTVK
jgi:hypothetical protein